ncbi:hypothetical protein, partial [Klebsiella pneumoniae]|uniref:hypothetical protein n=1 Tax=Klebsiella pneumoniae TaxID=573 RepID=UPI00405573EB
RLAVWLCLFNGTGFSSLVYVDTGLEPMCSEGVFLHSRSAAWKSMLSRVHFLSKLLAIFTVDSAFPFPWLLYGADVE